MRIHERRRAKGKTNNVIGKERKVVPLGLTAESALKVKNIISLTFVFIINCSSLTNVYWPRAGNLYEIESGMNLRVYTSLGL